MDLSVIKLTQLASRGVSRHLAGSISANHNGQMGGIFHFWWQRLKPIIFPCWCQCLIQSIMGLINKNSLPRRNVFGLWPGVCGKSSSPPQCMCFLFPCFTTVPINVTLLSALVQIILAHCVVFSPRVTSCLPLLTCRDSFSLSTYLYPL